MSASPTPPAGTGRHDRAADAFISSYLRELMADDERDAPPADAGAVPLEAVTDDEPAPLL